MLFRSVERGILPIARKSAGATSRVLRCISVGAVKVDSEDYVFKPFHAVSRAQLRVLRNLACGWRRMWSHGKCMLVTTVPLLLYDSSFGGGLGGFSVASGYRLALLV